MLSKFTRFDSIDAYLFINKFQKVYVIIKLQHLSDDAIKLHFITFAP